MIQFPRKPVKPRRVPDSPQTLEEAQEAATAVRSLGWIKTAVAVFAFVGGIWSLAQGYFDIKAGQSDIKTEIHTISTYGTDYSHVFLHDHEIKDQLDQKLQDDRIAKNTADIATLKEDVKSLVEGQKTSNRLLSVLVGRR